MSQGHLQLVTKMDLMAFSVAAAARTPACTLLKERPSEEAFLKRANPEPRT